MSDIDFRVLNLNLLPALAALLEEGGVGAAARRSGVSQSAMSHSLGRLRELLGDPLMLPSGRKMVLTPRGQRIALELPEALERLREVLAEPQVFEPSLATNTFVIATLDYFEFTTLPDVLTYLREHAPGVRLQIERLGHDTERRLTAGKVDLAITGSGSAFRAAGLRYQDLFEDCFRVIARCEHPQIGRRLTLETYLRLSHVLVSVEGRRDGVVDRALQAQGLSRQVALFVPHFTAAPIAVANSDLICTVASTVADRGQQLLGLRQYSPPLALDPTVVRLWWPRQHDADPGRRWLRELFTQAKVFPRKISRLVARCRADSGAGADAAN